MNIPDGKDNPHPPHRTGGWSFRPGRSNEALLLDFLSDRAAGCPGCGYNLHALTAPRCPECGIELVLDVHAAEQRLGYWTATLVALCLPAAFGTMFLLAVLVEGPPPPEMFRWPIIVPLLHILSAIPLGACLIWGRSMFLRISWGAQGVLAWMAIAAVFVSVLIAFRGS